MMIHVALILIVTLKLAVTYQKFINIYSSAISLFEESAIKTYLIVFDMCGLKIFRRSVLHAFPLI